MTDGSRRIRRRRSTSSDNLPEEVQLIPPSTIDRQRVRRKRSSSEDNLSEEKPPLPSFNTEHSFSEKNNQNSPNLITGIDQIRAEFIDDQRFSLVSSEYSDETHDWGEGASEDYWHFLGQYE